MKHIAPVGGVTNSGWVRAYELATSYLDGLKPRLLNEDHFAERVPFVDVLASTGDVDLEGEIAGRSCR